MAPATAHTTGSTMVAITANAAIKNNVLKGAISKSIQFDTAQKARVYRVTIGLNVANATIRVLDFFNVRNGSSVSSSGVA